MSGPTIVTLGCRLNIAESEALRAELADARDLVIVNSCAVTADAVAGTRKAIRRARRDHPAARLVVTGCAAQIEPATFAAMAEVDAVLDNSAKQTPGRFRGDTSPAHNAPHLAAAFTNHARGFVEVQNGCDHRCTFCIIPAGRGPSRSIAPQVVIDRIARLVDAGVREIVLTGVDVTSYGPDLAHAPTLGLLVERILAAVPALPRLRLSSLDAIEIDDCLFALLTQEPRLMPHLHLSLQAGDDLVLKRMKRRHSRSEAVALVQRLKAARPAIAIGADLIAGFPTESEAMFANTQALLDDCDVVHGHIFPYSPRVGTPAARMPQVDISTIRSRAAALRTAAAKRRAAWLATLVGTRQRILIERDGASGHAENFAPVRLDTPDPARAGEIVEVRIGMLEGDTLLGVSE